MNRIKPDIVSPGDNIVSAKSNGGNGATCSTLSMMGTSMASPTAAGSATLIRQYFVDHQNKFWTQMCNSFYKFCKAFTPSGVLVKAMILHSGSAMTEFNGNEGGTPNIPLGSPPDFTQGYGRINLMNVLPLSGYTGFDLFVDDLHVINEYSTNNYWVTVRDSSIPLKYV